MSQKYQKQTQRSRRKSPVRFRSAVVGHDGASVQLRLPIAEILAGVHHAVEAVAAEAGLLVMQTLSNILNTEPGRDSDPVMLRYIAIREKRPHACLQLRTRSDISEMYRTGRSPE